MAAILMGVTADLWGVMGALWGVTSVIIESDSWVRGVPGKPRDVGVIRKGIT